MRIAKMKRFNAIFDGLLNILAVIVGFFLIAMMFIECYEIVARYLLGRPTIWGVEACEYMLFFIAFLGAAWLLKKGGHISVPIVVERLRPRTQIYCHLLASLVGILIASIIFWFALRTSWENYIVGVRVVKTLSLPKWIFLSFIAFGYLLLFVEFIRQFLHQVITLWQREGGGQTP
jgi:C4-dicarboxylate transporter DctQ subunit